MSVTTKPSTIRGAQTTRRLIRQLSSRAPSAVANRLSGRAEGEATHFLLYLNAETFVGEAGLALAEEVRRVHKAGTLPIVMAHENDEAKGGCEFSTFFGSTPQDLLDSNLYGPLALAIYPSFSLLWPVSVALVAQQLGATVASRRARRHSFQTALTAKIDPKPRPEKGVEDESLSAAAKFRNSAALSSSSSSQPGEEIREMSQQEIARRRRESIKATEAYRESIKETEAYLRSCNEVSKEHPGREWRPKPSTSKPKVRRLKKPVRDLQKVGHLAQLSASLSPRRATHEPSGETRSVAGPSQASGVGLEASLTHAGVVATPAAVPHARDGATIRV